jgi:hypothetical protein
MATRRHAPLRVRHVIFAAFLLPISPADASQFFCAADLSTGFKLQSSGWSSVDFTVKDMRYTIAPQDSGGTDYTVTKLGDKSPSHRCKNNLPPGGKIHLVCGGLGYGFIFNERELRFQEYYGIGFVNGDAPGNTPSITIGKCSPIP